MRRYEILLPLRFNDGVAVPESLLIDVSAELRSRFGAESFETQTIRGLWQDKGHVYRDELVKVVVDVEDSDANRHWFVEFKESLKSRFRQHNVWIISHPIEVL